MKNKKLNLVNDIDQALEERNKEEVKREKMGRKSLLTPELWKKLIGLFEKHFFIAIVAASADIYRGRIDKWQREQENFHSAVMHARNKWIKHQMQLLKQYAKDKKTKDWRALKYLLSIADIEYNDKKYLKELPGKASSQTLIININQKDLTQSKEEANKLIGSSSIVEEEIPLMLFEPEKTKAKKAKKAKS